MKNLKINRKAKKTELELKSYFYPEHIIREVIEDFGKILNADVEKNGDKFLITLKPIVNKIGIEKITYDFLNYLFAEVKNYMVKV
jgi:hypothetical protein